MPGCVIESCKVYHGMNISRVRNRKPQFHRFPKDPTRLKIWLKACKREDLINNHRHMRICSDHFRDEDYERNLKAELLKCNSPRQLKRDAVPCLYLSGKDAKIEVPVPTDPDPQEVSSEPEPIPEPGPVGTLPNVKELRKRKNNLARKKRIEERDRKKLVAALLNDSETQRTSSSPQAKGELDHCIDLNGRCVFCLERTDSSSLSKLNENELTKIWPYIQPKWNDNLIPGYAFINANGENVPSSKSKIPTMCSPCLDSVLELNETLWKISALKKELMKLESEVKEMGQELRKRAMDSEETPQDLRMYAARYKTLLVELVKERAESKVVSNTIVFLNQLRGCAVDLPEENSSLPPPEVFEMRQSAQRPSVPESAEGEVIDDVKIEIKAEPELSDEDEEAMDPFMNSDVAAAEEPEWSPDPRPVSDEGAEEVEEPVTPVPKQAPQQSAKRVESATSTQICEVCGLEIPLSGIYMHLYSHVGEFAFQCPNPQCNYTFLTKFSHGYLKHRMNQKICWDSSESLRNKVCEQCSQSKFKYLRSYGNHLKSHETKVKYFHCPLKPCEESFTLKQSLEYHLHTCHDLNNCTGSESAKIPRKVQEEVVDVEPTPTTTLQKCQRPSCKSQSAYLSPEEMESHLKEHHQVEQDQIQKCKFCPFIFPDMEGLIQHVHVHCDADGIGVPCELCPSECAPLLYCDLSIRRHYFRKHSIGTKLICEHEPCKFSCLTVLGMRNHLAAEHKIKMADVTVKKSSYRCRHCPQTFSYMDTRHRHEMAEHAGAQLPKYQCSLCPKKTLTKGGLESHFKKEHTRQERITLRKVQYPCSFCKKEFPFKVMLKGHIAKEHQPYCIPCQRTFHSRNNLRRHQEVQHNPLGRKRWKCSSCDQAFRLLCDLKRHEKYVHLGLEGEYVCDVCGRRYRQSRYLLFHKLSHSKDNGERPYQCDICGERFRQREYLNRHLKRKSAHQGKGKDASSC